MEKELKSQNEENYSSKMQRKIQIWGLIESNGFAKFNLFLNRLYSEASP